MAAVEYLNRPIESSKDLILKEAFKLFLQKNVEKVTVPELERVTKLQRGAIFYPVSYTHLTLPTIRLV